jgi:hypothetical protein
MEKPYSTWRNTEEPYENNINKVYKYAAMKYMYFPYALFLILYTL